MKKLLLLLTAFLFCFTVFGQTVNIPDANFKNALLNHDPIIDTNGDSEIQTLEANNFNGILDVSQKNISDLTGIEYFINITDLLCNNNALTSIDISNNTLLQKINCAANSLTVLIISQNPMLVEVSCNGNNLATIDTNSNTNLEVLNVAGNSISSLNLSANNALKNLKLDFNPISTIDVSNNTNLEVFKATYCYSLGNVNFANNLLLEQIWLWFSNQSSLDVSNMSNLRLLNLRSLNVSVLDVSNNTDLFNLNLTNNNISFLDLSNNLGLTYLTIDDYSITTIDASNNTSLVWLDISGNQIQTINAKNGANTFFTNFRVDNTPNLQSICVDDLTYATNNFTNVESPNLFTENCVGSTNTCDDPLIVCIPDVNFKNKLINYSPTIDLNGDGEIQYTEASTVTVLDVSSLQSTPFQDKIFDLTGIEAFVNIQTLQCNFNKLSTIDLNMLTNLTVFYCIANNLTTIDTSNNANLSTLFCVNNQIASVDFSQNPSLYFVELDNNNLNTIDVSNNYNLYKFHCGYNNLTNIDLSNNQNLQKFYCQYNNFTSIDLSNNPINSFQCNNNNDLVSFNVKNGEFFDVNSFLNFENNPNLEFICIDNDEYDIINAKIQEYGYTTNINSYCNFNPGGEFYSFNGTSIIDLNGDGCNDDQFDTTYQGLRLNINYGSYSESIYANELGEYNSLGSQSVIQTVTPVLENLDYFTVIPSPITLNFNTISNPYIQNFCIVPDGVINDLEIVIIPLSEVRPGEISDYKLIYKNKGNSLLDGDIVLNFDDDYMDYSSAIPNPTSIATSILTWNFLQLLPFETREIDFSIQYNLPTDPNYPLNAGNLVTLSTIINPIVGDNNLIDNSFEIIETVLNSYDPNNKICLQGDTIELDTVGEYVHYIIRFENIGNANANNVVIKDIINTQDYKMETLQTYKSSHNYTTKISNYNEVEFIFENIDLPFDNENNDGYILYKIKTKDNLIVGDLIENNAEIYFDYNFPIITNVASTEVVENNLSLVENNLNQFITYPNPANNILNIQGKTVFESVTVFDINGRLLKTITSKNKKVTLDVSSLSQGLYFLEIKSRKSKQTLKFIKE